MTQIEEIRARILTRANPAPLPVDVPAWGRVWVRVQTVADMEAIKQLPEDKHRLARSVARVLCDEAGVLLFDPESDSDVASIAALPWVDLSAVLKAAESAASPPVEGGQGNA